MTTTTTTTTMLAGWCVLGVLWRGGMTAGDTTAGPRVRPGGGPLVIRGPNVCGERRPRCCPGWKLSRRGLCITPVHPHFQGHDNARPGNPPQHMSTPPLQPQHFTRRPSRPHGRREPTQDVLKQEVRYPRYGRPRHSDRSTNQQAVSGSRRRGSGIGLRRLASVWSRYHRRGFRQNGRNSAVDRFLGARRSGTNPRPRFRETRVNERTEAERRYFDRRSRSKSAPVYASHAASKNQNPPLRGQQTRDGIQRSTGRGATGHRQNARAHYRLEQRRKALTTRRPDHSTMIRDRMTSPHQTDTLKRSLLKPSTTPVLKRPGHPGTRRFHDPSRGPHPHSRSLRQRLQYLATLMTSRPLDVRTPAVDDIHTRRQLSSQRQGHTARQLPSRKYNVTGNNTEEKESDRMKDPEVQFDPKKDGGWRDLERQTPPQTPQPNPEFTTQRQTPPQTPQPNPEFMTQRQTPPQTPQPNPEFTTQRQTPPQTPQPNPEFMTQRQTPSQTPRPNPEFMTHTSHSKMDNNNGSAHFQFQTDSVTQSPMGRPNLKEVDRSLEQTQAYRRSQTRRTVKPPHSQAGESAPEHHRVFSYSRWLSRRKSRFSHQRRWTGSRTHRRLWRPVFVRGSNPVKTKSSVKLPPLASSVTRKQSVSTDGRVRVKDTHRDEGRKQSLEGNPTDTSLPSKELPFVIKSTGNTVATFSIKNKHLPTTNTFHSKANREAAKFHPKKTGTSLTDHNEELQSDSPQNDIRTTDQEEEQALEEDVVQHKQKSAPPPNEQNTANPQQKQLALTAEKMFAIFKTKRNQSLRHYLKDPRIRSLLRSMAARRMRRLRKHSLSFKRTSSDNSAGAHDVHAQQTTQSNKAADHNWKMNQQTSSMGTESSKKDYTATELSERSLNPQKYPGKQTRHSSSPTPPHRPGDESFSAVSTPVTPSTVGSLVLTSLLPVSQHLKLTDQASSDADHLHTQELSMTSMTSTSAGAIWTSTVSEDDLRSSVQSHPPLVPRGPAEEGAKRHEHSSDRSSDSQKDLLEIKPQRNDSRPQAGHPGDLKPGAVSPGHPGDMKPGAVSPGHPGHLKPGAVSPGHPGDLKPSTFSPGHPGDLKPGTFSPGHPGDLKPGAVSPGHPGDLKPGAVSPGHPGDLKPGAVSQPADLKDPGTADKPLASEASGMMGDDGRLPISGIVVEDINMPDNDDAQFSISRKKRPTEIKPNPSNLKLPTERHDDSLDPFQEHDDEDLDEEDQHSKADVKKLFPNHQIIDLDIRFHRRPILLPPPARRPRPPVYSPRDDTETEPFHHMDRDIRVDPYLGVTEDSTADYSTTTTRPKNNPPDKNSKENFIQNPNILTDPTTRGVSKNRDDERLASKLPHVTAAPYDVTARPCRGPQCTKERQGNEKGVATAVGTLLKKEPGPLRLKKACPPGHRRVFRDRAIVCQPFLSSFHDVTKDRMCGPGQVPVKEGNHFTCQHPGERPPLSSSPPRPNCPPGQKSSSSKDGPVCLPELSTTTASTPASSDPPCPPGMTPVESPAGVVCLPAGDSSITSPSPPQTTTTTPPTTDLALVPRNGAHDDDDDDDDESTDELRCPEGMVVIKTRGRKVCGFPAGLHRGPQCPEGQVLRWHEGRHQCRPRVLLTDADMPCPVGQTLVRTSTGTVCHHNQDSTAIHVFGYYDCKDGHILTQTSSGFFCLDGVRSSNGGDEESFLSARLPRCRPGSVAVKLLSGELECLRRREATLKCSSGMELKKTSAGFFCQRRMQADSGKKCRKGEALFKVHGGRSFCQRLQQNGQLCKEGYQPQLSALGFRCKKQSSPLSCPRGFYLAKRRGNLSCLPMKSSIDICRNGIFAKVYGKRVVCKQGDLHGVLLPCEEGYDVNYDEAKPACELRNDVTVSCVTDTNGTIPSCTIKKKTACGNNCQDGALSGAKSCKEIHEEALQGCQPKCANGGSCVEGRCVCPAGVTGTACQEDIDECQKLSPGHCQHGCINLFGSFRCTCPQNATLNVDGRTCHDRDCSPRCLNGGTCRYDQCVCPSGFDGPQCQHDVNECLTGVGQCDHLCVNTMGRYTCLCPPGSRLSADRHTCINDTCSWECRNSGRCEGGRCRCAPGFTGLVCQLDINECRGKHGCSHKCTNSYGSFRCTCPRRFTLKADGKTCTKYGRPRKG